MYYLVNIKKTMQSKSRHNSMNQLNSINLYNSNTGEIIEFKLESDLSNYTKYLRNSDTKYIKPRGLPAIEDPEQSYKLKHFKKLNIFGYAILGGKLDFICEKLDACMIEIAENYANIHSVGISISDQLGIKPKKKNKVSKMAITVIIGN
jgi:hypothetical protein